MSFLFSDQFLEPLDRYQYLIFKWILFIIFVATALEVLERHLHLKTNVKRVVKWLVQK
jgi:hypothetical protein